MGVFHSENWIKCKNYYWESFRLAGWAGIGDCESFALHTKSRA